MLHGSGRIDQRRVGRGSDGWAVVYRLAGLLLQTLLGSTLFALDLLFLGRVSVQAERRCLKLFRGSSLLVGRHRTVARFELCLIELDLKTFFVLFDLTMGEASRVAGEWNTWPEPL